MKGRSWKGSLGFLFLLSKPLVAQVDFQGLIQGQAVLLRETRTEEFQQRPMVNSVGLTVNASPREVGKYDATGDLRWSFSGGSYYLDSDGAYWVSDPFYEGTLPDETDRSLPDSPVWQARHNPRNSILGSVVLISNNAIPEGKWVVTAELLYGVFPFNFTPPAAPFFSRVELMLTCSLPAPAYVPILEVINKKEFKREEPSWRSESLSVALIGNLSPCKAAGGDLYLQFTASRVKRFQFNGVQITMSQVQ